MGCLSGIACEFREILPNFYESLRSKHLIEQGANIVYDAKTLNLPAGLNLLCLQCCDTAGRTEFTSGDDGLADESTLFAAATEAASHFVPVIAYCGIRIEACLLCQPSCYAKVRLDLRHGRITGHSHLF